MATKLFLRNTQTHGLTPSGDTTWYDMVIAAGASADTGVVNTVGSGTEIQWTKTAGGATIAWISGRVPAGGFTLTSVDVDLWCHESNGQANCGARIRVFKRAANGTITELTGGPFNDGVEFGTSAASMTWVANVGDTAFAEDDRILLRVYITNVGTMGSGRTCTITFNAANAATGDSFFNIAETVTFKAEAVDATATPAGVATAASLGDETATGEAAIGPTGQAATSALGDATVTGGADVTPTGQAATAAVGSPALTGTAEVSPPGVSATAGVGAAVADGGAVHGTATPSGVSAEFDIGEAVLSAGADTSPTGQTATATPGSPALSGGADTTPPGQQAATALGDETPVGGADAVPAGQAMAAAVGDTTETGSADVTPTGQEAPAAVGDTTESGAGNVAASGVGAEGDVGDAVASGGSGGDVAANPEGVSATADEGAPIGTGDANVTPTGVAAAADVGIATQEEPLVLVPMTTAPYPTGMQTLRECDLEIFRLDEAARDRIALRTPGITGAIGVMNRMVKQHRNQLVAAGVTE